MHISNAASNGTVLPGMPLEPMVPVVQGTPGNVHPNAVHFGQSSAKQALVNEPIKTSFDVLVKRLLGIESSAPQHRVASPSATEPALRTMLNPPAIALGNAAPASTPVKSTANDFLDSSKYSSPDELQRWSPLVAGLLPEQREQAAKELNRPIAAARMAADKGPDAQKAMQFINENPALKTAIDTAKRGGKADGKISDGDLKSFAKKMQSAADDADKTLAQFQKDNPDADPQSLQMVRSASLLQANSPLTTAAGPKEVSGNSKVDKYTNVEGLKAMEGNPGLSVVLKQASKTFLQPGFLDLIDKGGDEGKALATSPKDNQFDASNISRWIKTQAPTNEGEFAGMLSDAATLNAVAGVDISALDANIFKRPQDYSGQQKAAVMVKLQQTEQSVIAGQGLRKTGKTEEALAEKIGQLQADPDVRAYMNNAVPSQERALIASDPALGRAVKDQMVNLRSGQALRSEMNTADKAAKADQARPDYSRAINGQAAQLQMQRDLLGPDASLPTAQQIISHRPDIQGSLKNSYEANFSRGQALKHSLAHKDADPARSLQQVDAQRAIYDSVLPGDFTQAQQARYVDSTFTQLRGADKGREWLGQLINGTQAPVTNNSPPDARNRAEKLKDGYDATKAGLSTAKQGIDAARSIAGREASAGLGRMAGAVGGRVVGMVAGHAAGLAAASAIGVAAGPVGWVIEAVIGLGLGIAAIVEAVKKHDMQKKFDRNVDPTLDQFGIPKAH
ncbi:MULTISPECIES: type III effector HrpK domain-containing protein [Pseudomonas]|uniref:Type III effector HrpK domain-containing protein n=1 Tax=Pseudomonas wuhanensis TaxID=2954098 RepID=A0ABY9GL67_9PSED|nr:MULTISPECIES: type III effector HrpK domain-containing protein [unclassified Pseudomonas]WLI10681.1 type III effector HrpK domain-containing protein [Pseudomonas sp. FP603]WLI16497.1 type III effector HrpK domain-containing protein [Pseudomonas sp. FP607]